MNCKKGEMAIVVGGNIDNVGKVVTCVAYLGFGYCNGFGEIFDNNADYPNARKDHWWAIDKQLAYPKRFDVGVFYLSYYPDGILKPLRGDLLDDEENIRDKTPETV